MPALHHVAIAAEDAAAWEVLLDAVADGDVVVLLDRAAAQARETNSAIGLPALLARQPGVRWVLPIPELAGGDADLPAAVEVIDEAQWLAMIVAYPVLLEWS